jgi:tRNA-binding protein
MTDPLYHLARRSDWDEVVAGGRDYRWSTLGRTLEDEGFIHCSYGHQVAGVADLFYRGRDDVVLLVIDAARVGSPIRDERPAPDGAEAFPHIYGPLPLRAVATVVPVPLGEDGRLVFAGLVGPRKDGTVNPETAIDNEVFTGVGLRVGTVLEAGPNVNARTPALVLRIDLGDLGIKTSSAQITDLYDPESLVGRQVLCVCNLAPKRIAGVVSEVLVLGARDTEGQVVLAGPDHRVPDGSPVM